MNEAKHGENAKRVIRDIRVCGRVGTRPGRKGRKGPVIGRANEKAETV